MAQWQFCVTHSIAFPEYFNRIILHSKALRWKTQHTLACSILEKKEKPSYEEETTADLKKCAKNPEMMDRGLKS